MLPTYELKPVLPTTVEGLELRMGDLAFDESANTTAACMKLAVEYETWIKAREREIDSLADLSSRLREAARSHMRHCRDCLRRMREGAELVGRDTEVAQAFRLMNEAMEMQQIHYRMSSQETRHWVRTRKGWELSSPFNRPSYETRKSSWRPFQLAFILMNLNAFADPRSAERELVDVIWFPTGGGKTEAYLGLSAFSMFLRRLRNPDHAGTSILMRYTLRLLTTQQFQRAASLIARARSSGVGKRSDWALNPLLPDCGLEETSHRIRKRVRSSL